uniref:HD2-2 homeodomain protein n=1 Tax=Auricularia auricula-judae TaxID=29892 RepID=A0A6G8IXG4_AURAJ|nr:HD2-2 homeodomain protein [Auricularia auricula-judae]QKI37337.1 homeodomain protein HD2 [Auricularia auricula-judae]
MALEQVYQEALKLHSRVSDWLGQNPCRQPPCARLCVDPDLKLPSPAPIDALLVARGLQADAAKSLSDLYLGAATSLESLTASEYNRTLEGLADSHRICRPSTIGENAFVCNISSSLASSIVAAHQRKLALMLEDLLKHTTSDVSLDERAPHLFLHDYTPILEFAFAKSARPNTREKAILATVTGRTPKQISIWFQNRRAREKTRSSTSLKRAPLSSIQQLEAALQAQLDSASASCGRPACECGRSDNESSDSGYAVRCHRCSMPIADSGGQSGGFHFASESTVEDITRMLEDFHLDDRSSDAIQRMSQRRSRQCTTISELPVAREDIRKSTYSALSTSRRTCRTNSASSMDSSISNTHELTHRVVARMSRRGLHSTVTELVDISPPSSAPSPQALWPSHASPPTTAVSFNKARRSRKPASLPTRRPAHRRVRHASTSASPCPSLVSSAAPSRVPSESSDSSVTTLPNALSETVTPDAEQLYYRDASTGQFIPLRSDDVSIIPPEAGRAPCVADDLLSTKALLDLGPPGQPLFAPDDNPRAFSSNLLQAASITSTTHAPVLDSDATEPHVDIAAPAIFDHPFDALTSLPAKSPWSHNLATLDVVNFSYDQSWLSNANTNTWARLLCMEL